MPTHITCNLPISSYRPFPPFSKLLHTPATHCRLAVTWCGSFTVPRPRNVLQKTKDRSSACTCSTITCVSMIIYSEVGICPFRRIQCTLRMLMKHIINTIICHYSSTAHDCTYLLEAEYTTSTTSAQPTQLRLFHFTLKTQGLLTIQ